MARWPSRTTAHELGVYLDRYSFVARGLRPLLLGGLPTLRKRDVPKIHFRRQRQMALLIHNHYHLRHQIT